MDKKTLETAKKLQSEIDCLEGELRTISSIGILNSKFYCLTVEGKNVFLEPKHIEKIIPDLEKDKKAELAELKRQFKAL